MLRQALLQRSVVSADDLYALDRHHGLRTVSFAERVLRCGLVTDAVLLTTLCSLGASDATATVTDHAPKPAALGAFTSRLAERHRALPLAIEGKRLVTAMLDPTDSEALEKLSMYCGLVIEARACRGSVLFAAQHRLYGVPVPSSQPLLRPADPRDEHNILLPPPFPLRDSSAAAGERASTVELQAPQSPLASAIREVAGTPAADDGATSPLDRLLERRAARTPAVTVAAAKSALALLSQAGSLAAARDSLPAPAFQAIMPNARAAVLFIVRRNIAVGWAGAVRSGVNTAAAIRDVLIPLPASSCLQRAFDEQQVALSDPRDPGVVERTLLRLLMLPPPRAACCVPIMIGSSVAALLYCDSDRVAVDAAFIDDCRRAGVALGESLAPLLAAELVFEPNLPQLLSEVSTSSGHRSA